jgi:hypothetical protein
MKQILISLVMGLLPLLTFSQSDSGEARRCQLNRMVYEKCWSMIDLGNGQRYVGMIAFGKPEGDGILYSPNGVINNSGFWNAGELFLQFPISASRFPFDDLTSMQVAQETKAIEKENERKLAEIERNRPPQQKIAFCVQTVQSSGTRFPSASIPYCQDACNKTYADRMCAEVGGSKWRIQAVSPKTSPPNSQYFTGFDKCACIGQEYVLNEIKETPPPAALPAPTPASAFQVDLREAELAKREKALVERERALLEAENKRLREELEAERKKKK